MHEWWAEWIEWRSWVETSPMKLSDLSPNTLRFGDLTQHSRRGIRFHLTIANDFLSPFSSSSPTCVMTSTTLQPLINHSSTTHQPLFNHSSTTHQPLFNHLLQLLLFSFKKKNLFFNFISGVL